MTEASRPNYYNYSSMEPWCEDPGFATPSETPSQNRSSSALEIWETYILEGEKLQERNETGFLGNTVAYFQSKFGDKKTLHEARKKQWMVEKQLVSILRQKLKSGNADNLNSALLLVYKTSSGLLKNICIW